MKAISDCLTPLLNRFDRRLLHMYSKFKVLETNSKQYNLTVHYILLIYESY